MRPSSKLRRGEIFTHFNNEIAIVEDGALILEITMLNGASLCVHRVERGEYIVPLDMFASPAFSPCYSADAITRIGWLRRSATSASRIADADQSIDRAREKLFRACLRLIHELACLPTPHRLYCELLRMAATQHEVADPILPLPTQAELALRLCTTRESISREISFLRREGVLSAGKMPRLNNRAFLISRIVNALNLTHEDEVWESIGAPSPQ